MSLLITKKKPYYIKNFLLKNFEDTLLVKNHFERMSSNLTFSLKFFTLFGLQLGGHLQLLDQTTTSAVFGLRNSNTVIDINKTVLELLKVSKILEGLGLKRSVLYFINNIKSLRCSLYYCYGFYNRHLFFPLGMEIISYFRTLKYLKMSRRKRRKLKKFLGFRRYSFFRAGISLLKKFFISSKWPFGFLSNNSGFKHFFKNVYHDEVKVGKFINEWEEKVDQFIDYVPLLPHYGFIGDHRLNFWIVNEFRCASVPHNSFIDSTTNKACFSMYGVPGNGCSLDTSMIFIILMISNYFSGYNEQIYKFNLKKNMKIHNMKFNIFFKKYENTLSKL